jgi:hypothetical protein
MRHLLWRYKSFVHFCSCLETLEYLQDLQVKKAAPMVSCVIDFLVSQLSRFWPQSKHDISTIMIRFSYYAYVGISSFQHQFGLDKANGLAATAPCRPSWLQPIPSVNVPNWVNDIYLTPAIVTVPRYSRFAESEFDWQHSAHHVGFPRNSSLFQSTSHLDPLSPNPTSCWSSGYRPFHQSRSVYCSSAPRFPKPGSSSSTMVLDLVCSSSLLRSAACTIPPLREHLPFFLHFPHHSYFTIRSAFPFSFSSLPIYLGKILATKENQSNF